MFDFLRKKKYKRPDYYPVCRVRYIKKIKKDGTSLDLDRINFCCDEFKEISGLPREYPFFYYNSDVVFNFSDYNNKKPFLFIRQDKGRINSKIFYCPFCGAKIVMDCIKTLKEVKTGCDEIIEPEKVIPAKTKKVCKYEWKEVEED